MVGLWISGSAIISVVGWPTDVLRSEHSILILNIGLANKDDILNTMWNAVVVATNRNLSLCLIPLMLELHKYKFLCQRLVMSR